MLTSAEIRQVFLDFFAKKCGHTYVPSSPVVPHGDPTLLFANAGMNQFKDVFLGVGSRPYTRAVNTQKCIRAGGKHNDLDDVGKDTYHHTFFEMLGNWSFGDYFKKEAITWAWELLTQVWGLDRRRLHVTVFEGNPASGLAPDDEAADLWRTLTNVDPNHIHLGSMKDNFWEMGDTGPCGPCTEIHYDCTPDFSGRELVNKGDARVIEIWNLVFIQFNRDSTGALTPLPAKHVDTGMGFERVCAVLQGKASNYDTDVFQPFFKAIAEITGAKPYGGSMTEPRDIAYRVLADHIRTLTFALTDGAKPDNEGRGYVLRRILRRAVRYGKQNLGVERPFFHKLVPTVVETMGGVFGELRANPGQVADIIRDEEEQFLRTIDRGIELFNREAERGGQAISGDVAFELESTYGFPYDLTLVMAQEQGKSVDEARYLERKREHQEISRGKAGEVDVKQHLVELVQKQGAELGATQFVGDGKLALTSSQTIKVYEQTPTGFESTSTLKPGQRIALVVEQTPFYAEAGGQVGDTGVIGIGKASLSVEDTVRMGTTIFHLGVVSGSLGVASGPCELRLEVNAERRGKIMAHHSATHVLNHALRDVLGDEVAQRGSLVDDEKTRFDFSHGKAVSAEEVEKVEALVQDAIEKDWPVYAAEAPQEDALKIHGLRAVFGEKYPPRVRVVSIGVPLKSLLADPGNKSWRDFSVEFCGGTHVPSTAVIKRLVLTHEESVAKGVRRLVGVAGAQAEQIHQAGVTLLRQIGELDASSAGAEKRLAEIQEQLASGTYPLVAKSQARAKIADLQKALKEAQKKQSKATAGNAVELARKLADEATGAVLVAEIPDADSQALRSALDVLRQKQPQGAFLLGSASGDKVAFVAAVASEWIAKGLKAGDWVREAAAQAGGSGGGRPDMAQAGGKEPEKLAQALDHARAYAKKFNAQ